MNNKKLLALFSCLICISVCIFLLTACGGQGGSETTAPSESTVETTEPAETQVPTEEITEAPTEETTEESTEETTEEATEEPTQPVQQPGSGSSGQNPTTPQQTEPEETEPEQTIAVPAPGTENNAYVENFSNAAGAFTTVKIPAGKTIYYTLKTPAYYMQIQDADIRVIWNGKTYKPADGVLQMELPANGEKSMAMQFVNKGKKDKIFAVTLLDAKGSATNPNPIKAINNVKVTLHKNKVDAAHYIWTADSDGILRVGVARIKPKNTAVDVVLSVNGTEVKLSDSTNGVAQIAVVKGDKVSVAVSGNGKAAEAVLSGYVVPTAQLTVSKIPSSAESIAVPAQGSVIYQIFGGNGNVLRIKHANVTVLYNGTVYEPDENGFVTLDLVDEPAQIELCNTGNKDHTYTFSFSYPLGHNQNPEQLTQIKKNTVNANVNGYWYSYTAKESGELVLGTKTENVEIFLLNNRTQQYANLWYTDENGVSKQGETVCVRVEKGDTVSIQILHAQSIQLPLTGMIVPVNTVTVEKLPYSTETAKVEAGQYVLYEVSGIADSVLTIEGKKLSVIVDGQTYAPDEKGVVSVHLSNNDVQIQICNDGSKAASYKMHFNYRLGAAENPQALRNLNAVKTDLSYGVYYYSYTAKVNGQLSFSTDNSDTYIVLTNEKTGKTASLWYTDDDGTVVKDEQVTVAVSKDDSILIQVVSGAEEATEATVSGLEETIAAVKVEQLPYQVQSVKISGNGYVYYDISGAAGNMLTIKGKNVSIIYNGTTYTPNESNVLSVKLAENAVRIQLLNNGKKEASFMMNFHYPVGHSENAQMLTALGKLEVIYENGIYNYTYTAQCSGQISFAAADEDTYIVLTNQTTGETNNLWHTDPDGQVVKNEKVSVDAQPGDTIAIQVFAMAEQSKSTITGWEDSVEKLVVEQIPYSVDTVEIAADNYVIYEISGAAGNMLHIQAQNVAVEYDGTVYEPDENGVVALRLTAEPAQVRLMNTGDNACSYTMQIHYPVGHENNPHILTGLGAMQTVFENGSYYYSYTAKLDGKLIFGTDNADTYIVLVNETTEKTAALWFTDTDGELVKNETVALDVATGDIITVQVFAMDADMTASPISGWESYVLEMTQEQLPATVETAQIAAGESAFYLIEGIEGQMLHITADDLTVYYAGSACTPNENGVISVKMLPEKLLELCNTGAADRTVELRFDFAVGHAQNPEVLTALGTLDVTTENGSYSYVYTALSDGKVIFTTDAENADIRLTNLTTEETATLYTTDENEEPVKNTYVGVAVEAGQHVSVQIVPVDEEDVQAQITGAEATVLEISSAQLPGMFETLPVAAAGNVYYEIVGACGNILTVEAADAVIYCNGVAVEPDENGVITLKLGSYADEAVLLQISNNGEQEQTYDLHIAFPVGHANNPETITEIGEITTTVEAGTDGYFYTYTAEKAGQFVVNLWENPEDTLTDILLTNSRTGETASLWAEDENGDFVFNYSTALLVLPGDQIIVQVTITSLDDASVCIDGEAVLYTALCGDAQNPIEVYFPGFTAQIPAGETLYYQGYNLSELLLSVPGDVAITYNGTTYSAVDGVASCLLMSPARMPATFALTNTGSEVASYAVQFLYPLGHNQNPETLRLGTNTVHKVADGMSDHIYTYIASKDGILKLHFDATAQWVYAVDNLDQGIYGENCYSSDDPLINETQIQLSEGDSIQIRVNTYDPENTGINPAGTVTFTADLYTGPVEIADITAPYQLEVLAGETVKLTANAFSQQLKIVDAMNVTLVCGGETYTADESGTLQMTFPANNGGAEVLEFTIHNGSTTDKNFTLMFGEQKGTADNPDAFIMGTNVAVCDAGGDGYHYTFTAEKAGKLMLTLSEGYTWKIKYGSRVYNSDRYKSLNLNLTAGKTVELIIFTYDPSNPNEVPAGSVEFTVAFE